MESGRPLGQIHHDVELAYPKDIWTLVKSIENSRAFPGFSVCQGEVFRAEIGTERKQRAIEWASEYHLLYSSVHL